MSLWRFWGLPLKDNCVYQVILWLCWFLIGYERIRANHDGDTVELVDLADLQDKSNRYYYQESRVVDAQCVKKNSEKCVYLSQIDLKMENGVLDDPAVAVLRFISPGTEHCPTAPITRKMLRKRGGSYSTARQYERKNVQTHFSRDLGRLKKNSTTKILKVAEKKVTIFHTTEKKTVDIPAEKKSVDRKVTEKKETIFHERKKKVSMFQTFRKKKWR